MITQSELKDILHYDQDTGVFTWINPKRKLVINCVAGTTFEGYIIIKINNKQYRAHRLAWLYVYGKFPSNLIDHINGIRNDNRLCNLRECTNQQNLFNRKNESNNTSGFKGVYWETARQIWKVCIVVNNKHIYLGRFKEKQEAINSYLTSAKKYHGEFYRGDFRA